MEFIGGRVTIKEILEKLDVDNNKTALENFWINNAPNMRWGILWNVIKTRGCRRLWGKQTYICPKCGEEKYVFMTCKSRFCSSCGKRAADKWADVSLSEILDVEYSHLFFTLPKEFRSWIAHNRKIMLDIMFRAVREVLLKHCAYKGFRPGITMVLHTFGADIKWHPHMHVIITMGGLSHNNKKWIARHKFQWKALMPMFRYRFLKYFAEEFKKGSLKKPQDLTHITTAKTFNSWLSQFHEKSWYVFMGKTLKDANPLIKYIGRYTRRPVIAEGRLISCSNSHVSFKYLDKATETEKCVSIPIQTFLKRIFRHIPDHGYRMIRHAGLFAGRVKNKLLTIARNLLKQKKKKAKKISWRESIIKNYGYDPLKCSKCGTHMVFRNFEFTDRSRVRLGVIDQHGIILQKYHNMQFAGFP